MDCVTGVYLTLIKLSTGWSKWELTGTHRNSLLLQDLIIRSWGAATTCRCEQRYFPRLQTHSEHQYEWTTGKRHLVGKSETKVILCSFIPHQRLSWIPLMSMIKDYHTCNQQMCLSTTHYTSVGEPWPRQYNYTVRTKVQSQGCAKTNKWSPFTAGI